MNTSSGNDEDDDEDADENKVKREVNINIDSLIHCGAGSARYISNKLFPNYHAVSRDEAARQRGSEAVRQTQYHFLGNKSRCHQMVAVRQSFQNRPQTVEISFLEVY